MDYIQYLSQFNLLKELSTKDLLEMDQLTSITVFQKNTFIQTPETYREGFYFIKKGKVRLYKLSAEGKQFTSDILGEGNVFGEMDVLSLGTRENYIEAIEESHICLMNRDRFESFIIHRPGFMMNLLKVLSERINGMSQLTENLAIGNLHEKIVFVLLKLADQFGVTENDDYYQINYSLSHQEIANLVGATREAVSVSIQELAKDKRIRTGFKTIAVHRDLFVARKL
ncbi:Crp/Fnr family transcriptional regulator [Brevibacillus reuszeri]|uniref:Crp/Fnr family transcriptional regulator n=1 Tax=Brevibacillus reuszeri TaxID=54915 RepID=UPI003D21102F